MYGAYGAIIFYLAIDSKEEGGVFSFPRKNESHAHSWIIRPTLWKYGSASNYVMLLLLPAINTHSSLSSDEVGGT